MYTCHGAVFRAPSKSAIGSFDELADSNLRLDLIEIGDGVYGVRSRSSVTDRIERLDQMALGLFRWHHAAFTVWYDSVWGALKFTVFPMGAFTLLCARTETTMINGLTQTGLFTSSVRHR